MERAAAPHPEVQDCLHRVCQEGKEVSFVYLVVNVWIYDAAFELGLNNTQKRPNMNLNEQNGVMFTMLY